MEKVVQSYLDIMYPDFYALNEVEKIRYERDRKFISDNFRDVSLSYLDAKKNGIVDVADSNLLHSIIGKRIAKEYFDKLHPNGFVSAGAEYEAWDELGFIEEHFDEIDLFYLKFNREGTFTYQTGKSQKEILKDSIKIAKGNMYLKMLHPEEVVSFHDFVETDDDRQFIFDHLDEIDFCFTRLSRFEDFLDNPERKSQKQMLDESIKIVKRDMYFKMLHPGDRSMVNDFVQTSDDEEYIYAHIDEIESYYRDCKNPESGAALEGKTDQEIVADAILHTKVETYMSVLHAGPIETMEDASKSRDDRLFLAEHLKEIEAYHNYFMKRVDSQKEDVRSVEKDILRKGIKLLKSKIYLGMLHPDTLIEPTAGFIHGEDKMTILNNVERIDAYYKAAKDPKSESFQIGATDADIVACAVEECKTKQKS